jgi:hypothetical protein
MQVFRYTGSNFVKINRNWNQAKLVLDVYQGKDTEGQKVIVYKRHNRTNQRWTVIYVDKAKKIQTKGYNQQFGFHMMRPFYMRSRLPMKRVTEAIGANNVVLKRWRKNVAAQTYYFDCVSKTIRSNYWKNYAMEIQSNGGSTNIRMTSGITSRWW